MDSIISIAKIIWSVFEYRPSIEVAVITLVVFTALLWLNILIIELWGKRRRKLIDKAERNKAMTNRHKKPKGGE